MVRQGRSLIEADEIRIQAGEQGIEQFVATGAPVHMLMYDTEKAEEPSLCENHGIQSGQESGCAVRECTASASQKLLSGERIIYNTLTQIVSAEAKPVQTTKDEVKSFITLPLPLQK